MLGHKQVVRFYVCPGGPLERKIECPSVSTTMQAMGVLEARSGNSNLLAMVPTSFNHADGPSRQTYVGHHPTEEVQKFTIDHLRGSTT